MRTAKRMIAAVFVFAAILTGTATAAPLAQAAACPEPGQRVKTSWSPRVYLVDPERELLLIQNEENYLKLWDNWNGIRTYDNLLSECHPGGHDNVLNGHLAKTPNDPRVYIWDIDLGYRWIVSGEVFNKYGFSWGKIHTIDSVSYRGPDWWR
jgi:hypothetical protein